MEESAEQQQMPQPEGAVPVDHALKHLEVFRLAAIQALVVLANLYGFAKESSGPLKPGVQAVEGTVKTVVGPVYHKFSDLPYEILKFVDQKFDDGIIELESRIPASVKTISSQAYSVAQIAPEFAKCLVSGVQRDGVVPTVTSMAKDVVAKCEPKAKSVYAAYEPVAEQFAVSTWLTLNRLPLFPQAAQVVVPTFAHWTEKYNSSVTYAAESGYSVAGYLPRVPIERISKIFAGDVKETAASD